MATASIRAAQKLAKHEIEVFMKYRARLIADVVAGKLDVREAAARLPDPDLFSGDEDPDDDFNRCFRSEAIGHV